MSMITATTWVPRGFAAPFPSRYQFDEDEYERISKLANLQLEDAKEELEEAQASEKSKNGTSSKASKKDDEDDDDDLKEYDLEHYDDEVAEDQGDTMAMFGNAKNLVFHENDEDDPYITMQGGEEEDEEDREELQILATDNLVLAGRIEDEVAHLEVYVYEDEDDNLYVHHDIMLPAIPLTVEWLDFPVGKSVGTNKTIKLWDLNTTKCAKSYTYHTDKVCSVAWHPVESTALLSGSYDRTVVAADMRAPDAKAPRWGVESDVETVRWNPHDANYFYVSTENGMIHYHDTRNAPKDPSASKPVWVLQAHDESISSFDINPVIPGYLVTGSTDKQVKLWNIQDNGPSMVVSRDLGVGRVFSTSFAPDKEVGFRLAVAGSKGAVQIWDTSTNGAVRAAFANKVPAIRGDGKERLVGLDEQDTDSDTDEGESDEEGEENGDEKGWESMEE
ncbi:WD40 repeat protein [Pyrenophora tritici-repentis]|nr:WD40 repeat protein [Pyrenophora tritici-repentis]KAI0582050.1 WD40 repeat protein [Pyrenophora tritici-repentis]KAI0611768.1 WD40 repeat protein [Pyrenophora tritici-repentis]KAI0623971.1 WD40 repeat protein [Pyrenophora tritici-repentis]KAI1538616.1 WD40 repeat [Pyrenophora tritici-repentis]